MKFDKDDFWRRYYGTRYRLREAGIWPRNMAGWCMIVCLLGIVATTAKMISIHG